MTAQDLMIEPPRAANVVDAYTAEVARQCKALVRTIALGFFIAMALSSTGIALAASGVDTDYMIWGPILCLSIGCALPTFVLGRIIMRDVRTARRLLRDGRAHRGSILRDVCLSYKTLHIIDVAWKDGERSYAARFTIPEIELAGKDDVIVFSLAKERRIAAAFSDRGVFVGRRTQS